MHRHHLFRAQNGQKAHKGNNYLPINQINYSPAPDIPALYFAAGNHLTTPDAIPCQNLYIKETSSVSCDNFDDFR